MKAYSSLLFVYGSLINLTNNSHHAELKPYCRYFGEGILQARLYRVQNYPGAVLSECDNDQVYGELYEISDIKRVLVYLDGYEECSNAFPEPREYLRRLLPINVGQSITVMAWTYLYNYDISNLERIASGRWCD